MPHNLQTLTLLSIFGMMWAVCSKSVQLSNLQPLCNVTIAKHIQDLVVQTFLNVKENATLPDSTTS